MNTDKERMELLISYLKVNGNELAASLGYKRSDRIYHVIRERNGISEGLARDICEVYPQISFDWLTKGEGEMLIEDTIVPESKEIPEGSESIYHQMMKAISELSEQVEKMTEINERNSRTIERLTELLFEKEQRKSV